MLIICYIKVGLASDFSLALYIKLSVWRRLGERLIRLGVRKGVACLASSKAISSSLVLILQSNEQTNLSTTEWSSTNANGWDFQC
jgi:hypothetical protein